MYYTVLFYENVQDEGPFIHIFPEIFISTYSSQSQNISLCGFYSPYTISLLPAQILESQLCIICTIKYMFAYMVYCEHSCSFAK